MTKLIIVRHCQAEGNEKRFFQGGIDTEITKKGAAQIGAVAELLKAEPMDVICTTSLKRARQTAEGINVYHELPILTDDRLSEIHVGEWEGLPLTEIEERYPEEYEHWNHVPALFQAPGGESMEQVYQRVKAAVNDIAREYDGKTVCIVSHGCAIRNLMCYLHGWALSQIGELSIGPNTSVSVVEFDGTLPANIKIESDSGHLELIR